MLRLYPAIDLIGGSCVRLMRGDFAQRNEYGVDLEDLARGYRESGSEWLHVIDLDAAKSRGEKEQLGVIQGLVASSGLKVQCGGGIQSRERLQEIFAVGVERAIIGSLCVKDPRLVRQWLEEFGPERIVLALDISYRGGTAYMAIHGWQELSEKTLWELLAEFPQARHVLCTDISRDGTLGGPNFALYRDIQQKLGHIELQASGGIASLSDLEQLSRDGIGAAVLGKSLLEGCFTLEQALDAVVNAAT